jgi:exodeoxyribonuclease VII large subunit
MTEPLWRDDTPDPRHVAAEGPEEPTVGVADLQRRLGRAVRAAFPDRLWVCGEIIGPPKIRGGGVGIAFSLGEARGNAMTTVRAWLGRPFYQELRASLGDAAIAELLAAGNLVVVGGYLQYREPFASLELQVDRVVRTPAGPGLAAQQRGALEAELAASGLLGRQRTAVRLPVGPRRVGIVAGGAGTVGYSDAVAVLERSGHQVLAEHFPAPLEGETAPARIAAQIRAAAVANQVVLVVRGGGDGGQLNAFNSAPVVRAIAAASVPVITGIGHSVDTTLADAAAYQACASPAAAAGLVAERLQAAARNLDGQLTAIQAAADRRLAQTRAAVRWRLGAAGVLAGLTALAIWRLGWPAAAVAILVGLAGLVVRRRRPAAPALDPHPAAGTFEDVVQELGAIKAALQEGTATSGEEVRRLLRAADRLKGRGDELLGRAGQPGRDLKGRS